MRATRELLLAGGKPLPFAVPALDGAEVLLRPLSPVEAEEVQGLQVEGIRVAMAPQAARPEGKPLPPFARKAAEATSMDIELAEVVKGSHRAYLRAAGYGLVEPAMSPDELAALRPRQVVEQIGQEVMARSGLGKNQADQLAQFRDLVGGPDDVGAAPVGSAAGGDAG